MFEELQQSLQSQLSKNPFKRGSQSTKKPAVSNDVATQSSMAHSQNASSMASSIMSANLANSPQAPNFAFAPQPPTPATSNNFSQTAPPAQAFPSNLGLFDLMRNQSHAPLPPPSDSLVPPPPPFVKPFVVRPPSSEPNAPPPPQPVVVPPPPMEFPPNESSASEGKAFLDAIRALRENGFNLDAAKSAEAKKASDDTQSATSVMGLLSSWKSKDEQEPHQGMQANPEAKGQAEEQPRQRKRRGWDPEEEQAPQPPPQQASGISIAKEQNEQQWPYTENSRRSRSKRRSHSRRRSRSGKRRSRSRDRRQRSRSRRSLRRDGRDARETRDSRGARDSRDARATRDTRDAERVRRQAGVPPVYEEAPDHKEVSIPQKFTSRLIGKAGSKIASIRQASGADITVRYATPDNEFSKVVIVGPPSKVAKAEEMIWETLGIEPGADVKEFEIPAEHVSAIIGPAGSNIAQMRAASGGIKIGVKIPDPPGSAPHKVWIGPALPEQIDIAVQLIQEKIKQNEGDLASRTNAPGANRLGQVPCKFFAQGSCKKGSLCPFSHGPDQQTASQGQSSLEWQAPASEAQTSEWNEWPAAQAGAHVPL